MLIYVSLTVLIIDQFTKFLVKSNMAELESIPIILNIFHLTYVNNRGAAFSLLQGRTYLFIAITIIAMVFAVYFYFRLEKEQIWLRLGIALALGGAMGNLIDRIRFGQVIDFFDFRIWPVFNIADCAVVIGVALICWQLLRMDLAEGNK
ncbi:MAG: signal peptidase II [Bacillota bacterium]|jgi:signal peptidase II